MHDSSLQLLMTVDERAEALYSPPQPHYEDHTQIPILHFKCELCSFDSNNSAALEGHLTFTHNPSIPPTSMWENNKCHICNKVFNKSDLFKNHMQEKHQFSDNSNLCTNCCEPNEVGLYRPEFYQAISMICKDCVLL